MRTYMACMSLLVLASAGTRLTCECVIVSVCLKWECALFVYDHDARVVLPGTTD